MLIFVFACNTAILYIYICQHLRFRRVKSILLNKDIVLISAIFDMPYTITTSLSCVLFRTYGIPIIAHLFVHTNRLVQLDTVGRRAEDTSVLYSEYLLHKLDFHRARMNLVRNDYLYS